MPIVGSTLIGLEFWDLSRLGVVGGFCRLLEYKDGGWRTKDLRFIGRKVGEAEGKLFFFFFVA